LFAFISRFYAKRFTILPHIHPIHTYTHSYTDGGADHARPRSARREQLEFSVLLGDTSTLS